jgi:hypothetical protein
VVGAATVIAKVASTSQRPILLMITSQSLLMSPPEPWQSLTISRRLSSSDPKAFLGRPWRAARAG